MQVLHTYERLVCVHTRAFTIFFSHSLRYHGVHEYLLFIHEKTLPPFFRLFLFARRYHLISRAARRPSSLSPPSSFPLPFAFIKYKQFHAFRLTPERFAEHIFTTWHSGFCQLPASRHFTDSSLCRM